MANSVNRPWEILDDSRRMKRVMRLCRERLYEIEKMVFSSSKVFRERLHMRPGPERRYWTAGYLQAMKDMMALLNTGNPPWQPLEEDGGPRLRVNDPRQS